MSPGETRRLVTNVAPQDSGEACRLSTAQPILVNRVVRVKAASEGVLPSSNESFFKREQLVRTSKVPTPYDACGITLQLNSGAEHHESRTCLCPQSKDQLRGSTVYKMWIVAGTGCAMVNLYTDTEILTHSHQPRPSKDRLRNHSLARTRLPHAKKIHPGERHARQGDGRPHTTFVNTKTEARASLSMFIDVEAKQSSFIMRHDRCERLR